MKSNSAFIVAIAASLMLALVSSSVIASPVNTQSFILITDTIPPADSVSRIYAENEVDSKAEFPGGQQAWWNHLAQHANGNVGVDNGAPGGKYVVEARFVVTAQGELKGIKPHTKHGYGMEAELVKVLRKSPKWIPAKVKGQPVDSYVVMPFTFMIEDASRSKKKKN